MQPNHQPNQNQSKGKLGEDLASKFLKSKGYRIIDRNFKARYGEIDLIAIFNNILVFVEVKTRWGNEFGKPEEAITPWKIRSVVTTAQYYKSVKNNLPETMQIDVVAVQINESGKLVSINHFENVTG
jgi:putative endonuclease